MLVTDLSMPGMDGIGLIKAARTEQPALPAILLTGYAGDAVGGAIEQIGGAFILMRKPASQEQLCEGVASLLTPAVAARRHS